MEAQRDRVVVGLEKGGDWEEGGRFYWEPIISFLLLSLAGPYKQETKGLGVVCAVRCFFARIRVIVIRSRFRLCSCSAQKDDKIMNKIKHPRCLLLSPPFPPGQPSQQDRKTTLPPLGIAQRGLVIPNDWSLLDRGPLWRFEAGLAFFFPSVSHSCPFCYFCEAEAEGGCRLGREKRESVPD
ncbi:hypothetical protein IF1G_04320 [Cordyceps javanica]|uniref:Uncharacterized protein n=1 Tax=Cordyceps javanica TaxID=43265 RepID=A0A545V5T9_9HYPO|nr:hypothetical protein IF1G_04320 [Cordyceps javanica]